MSLNVSPGLALAGDPLARPLRNYRRPVVLELTEESIIGDYDARAGFASLRHVLELDPAFVKLDVAIVRGVDTDPARQALVAGMRHFVRQTWRTLIAEGIETPAELAELRRLGVTHGQGFLLGHPAAVETWDSHRTDGSAA